MRKHELEVVAVALKRDESEFFLLRPVLRVGHDEQRINGDLIGLCSFEYGGCSRIQNRTIDRGRRAGRGSIRRASQAVLDEELVSDFRERVDDYMKLHEKLQRQGPRQRERDDVGENLVSETALAMRIRFARHDARPGDVFTPASRSRFVGRWIRYSAASPPLGLESPSGTTRQRYSYWQ